MRLPRNPVRTHRILGGLAVVHSALTLGLLLIALALNDERRVAVVVERVFVAVATLWFLWPVILALHPAQSARRVLTPLAVSAVFMWFWCRWWSTDFGPREFGLPDGMDLTPQSMIEYTVAYGCGFIDAGRDGRRGRLILEAYGFGTFTPSAPNFCNFPDKAKECGIELNHVTGCVVNTWILAHARSYNRVMTSKIRQHCPALVQVAEEEDARWQRSYDDGERDGRAEALRDIANGQLALEVTDVRKEDGEFEKLLRERYNIRLQYRDPESDSKWANKVYGHYSGYNAVAEEEVKRRFGKTALNSIWKARYQSSN